MSRTRRRRGPREAGLFAWAGGEQLVEDPLPDTDRRNPCPHCGALPFQPCTAPSHRGRRTLRGIHDSRRHHQETQP